MSTNEQVFRILVIDDTPGIHEDFRKVLNHADAHAAAAGAALDELESQLFGSGDDDDGDAPAAPTAPPVRFEIDSAYQGQAGVERLRESVAQNRPYAMAFVDMRMPPGWDGVQTIRELWKVEPNLQVAICTAYSDYTPDQIAAELKLDGRMLMLRKPFDQAEVRQLATTLCQKWSAALKNVELERLIEMRTAEFKHAALHDAMTQLPNRVLFADRLSHALLQSRRNPSRRFAVLFIDLDEFKVVNDSLGHDAGDALLLQVADRLGGCLREVDTLARQESGNADAAAAGHAQPLTARLGGDEFAILLEDIHSDADAARVAQRLVDSASQPYVLKGHPVHCAFSVGITTSSLNYDSPEAMLRDADIAMYNAKRAGRNRYAMFDRAMHDQALARLTFEADLRQAIERREIVVHYQPIVETQSCRVVGFEALARWQHPTRGMISPVEFIPIAEETGLIIPLGRHVLEIACRQLAAWQRTLPDAEDLTMSVNMSRKQLSRRDIVADIDRVVRETGIRPQNLKMEITESSVMADTHTALEVLKEIQRLNVQLQIDDFGTGYSSLSCLQMFPLNGLKIDRSFVQEILKNPQQCALLRAVVSMAHSIGMPLVTEGVETLEQAALLKSMGCDFAQGYLFAKPMDAEAASTFIQRHYGSVIAA